MAETREPFDFLECGGAGMLSDEEWWEIAQRAGELLDEADRSVAEFFRRLESPSPARSEER